MADFSTCIGNEQKPRWKKTELRLSWYVEPVITIDGEQGEGGSTLDSSLHCDQHHGELCVDESEQFVYRNIVLLIWAAE